MFNLSRCPEKYLGSRCQHHNPCFYSPCENGGTCRVAARDNRFESVCDCRPGFMDKLCLTPTDNVCLTSPCRNGGTCELINTRDYRCRCRPGWSGETIGECRSISATQRLLSCNVLLHSYPHLNSVNLKTQDGTSATVLLTCDSLKLFSRGPSNSVVQEFTTL